MYIAFSMVDSMAYDVIFDQTSLVNFEYEPELEVRSHFEMTSNIERNNRSEEFLARKREIFDRFALRK